MKVFLSHSSSDKEFVRRVNSDLKSHKFDTWLDEEQVLIGSSITKAIEDGVSQCDVLLLFLNTRALVSGWVSAEWRSKLAATIQLKKITIIPLLMDDCEIPPILADLRYADFREKDKYETSLSHLLRTLNVIRDASAEEEPKRLHAVTSIKEYTSELLDDLESEFLSFPLHRRLPLLDTLRRLPRSGKLLRLHSYRLPEQKTGIKVRSIYDHVLSMAHVADCLLPHIEHGVPEQDFGEIARCIAYHELNEVILGDIPTYTSLSNGSRSNARVYAEERLRGVPPKQRNQIVSSLIWLYLSEKQRKSMGAFQKTCANEGSHTYRTFKMLDKIDPIIAVWRYLHVYREQLGDSPNDFLRRMKDFFENPDLKAYLKTSKADPRVIDAATILQNRSCAWDYYVDPGSFWRNAKFSLPTDAVRDAIEGVPLSAPL